MDDATIRAYEPADEASVRGLSQRLSEGFAPWRDRARVDDTIASWIDSSITNGNDAGHALLVAADEAGVIGFVAVEVQNHYIDGRDGYIGELAIDDRFEGRGVGRQLLTAATEWARSAGCERMTLQTGAANSRAREFYEKLGFVYEDVSMAKEL